MVGAQPRSGGQALRSFRPAATCGRFNDVYARPDLDHAPSSVYALGELFQCDLL
jgi:hypothetical protein